MKPAGETAALLLLRLLPGVGDRRLSRALRSSASARSTLSLSRRDFSEAFGARAERARGDPAIVADVDRILGQCETDGIQIVSLLSDRYPPRLRELTDPPPVLFLRGDPTFLLRPCIAIIGSRRATGVGRRCAQRLAREASELGVAVVSGLALGIDGAAHRGALEREGGTIAVLGSGPDRSYPAGNRPLFEAILQRGLLVSEFPPGEAARPHHFPRRNRILAGLSEGVVVVEAARTSGAFITVDHAVDLGLEVFAVPGSVESPQAEGANALLKDGAHLATRAADVLEVLGWDAVQPLRPTPHARAVSTGTDPDLARVRAAVGSTPRLLDELVPRVELPMGRILASLTRLEMEGSVARSADGWYLVDPAS